MTKDMSHDCLLIKGKNISSNTIEGNSFIYLEDRKEIFQLDEIGSSIWQMIRKEKSVGEIIKNCLEVYDGDKKEIQREVNNFLLGLVREGLLSIKKEDCNDKRYGN